MMTEAKALRKQYGLTQQALSDLLGIPKRTIEDWDAGKASPPPYVLRLIAFYLEHR